MDRSGSQMDNPTVITPEALLPVVNKYFERFSAVQWNMLAEGIPDSATTAMLADLCTEVVQTLCTIILRMIKPMIEESFHRRESQADLTTSLQNLNTKVGDSLSGSFAVALHVPQEKCESAEQLTALVEREVTEKVNSIVSVAISSPVWPSQPAVFVSGSMSNITSLAQMVSHAAKCLTRYLKNLKFQCLGECWHPEIIESAPHESSESTSEILEIEEPEKCETPLSIKSKISVPLATKAVTDIFMKWSSETPDVTEEDEDSSLSVMSLDVLDVQEAASDIIKVILEDLHYDNFEYVAGCSEKSSSPTPHFNMSLIFNKVREFFAAQARPSDRTTDANQKYRKHSFSRFAQEQFDKMMAELKSKLKTQDSEFLVSLKKSSVSPQPRLTEDEYLLPGAVQESPVTTPEAPSPTSMMSEIGLETKKSTVSLETIKTDVDSLFDKLLQPEDSTGHASKTPENMEASDKIKKFSKELIDKVYGHLMAGQTYQVPTFSMDRLFSNSVISELKRKVGTIRLKFSPEVLYAMTEDAVAKFLQKLQLWLNKEPSETTSYSEEVSGALSDIQEVISNMLSTPETNDTIAPESPEVSDKQATPYSGQTPPPCEAAASESFNDEGVNVRDLVDSRDLATRESPEKYSEPPPVSHPSPEGCQPSQVPTPEEPGKGLLAGSSDSSSSITDEMTNDLMTALLLRLITKVPSTTAGSPQAVDINAITKRLTDVAHDQINMRNSDFRKTKDKMKKINKAMTKDLHKEFVCPEQLLEAATASDDPSFDDALVKYLEIHVNALPSPPKKKKKSKVARFFTAMGKALTKPFRWCIKGNRDD
ncbi:uncharacterized protein [Trachinotus anak]|uniref:uncharacterized protein n=1 Tax=Trachinotus anak TaxID=443729 RepID=UPI0039F1F2B9